MSSVYASFILILKSRNISTTAIGCAGTDWYAVRSDRCLTRLYALLRKRKVVGNTRKKEAAKTRILKATPEEQGSYNILQKLFSRPEILIYFDPSDTLYIDVDGSQERGFGAMVYHLKNGVQSQKAILPILFLSKLLSDAETRYWPTEKGSDTPE